MVRKQIENYLAIEDGWHFGEGIKPTEQNVNNALRFFDEFVEQHAIHIESFLGIDGSIQLSGYGGYSDSYVEIIIDSDSTVAIYIEESKEIIFSSYDMTMEDALLTLIKWGYREL
jgi:hypothetical protein